MQRYDSLARTTCPLCAWPPLLYGGFLCVVVSVTLDLWCTREICKSDVRVLTPELASLWFEAVSDRAPEREYVREMERLLANGTLKPHLRAVVEHDGQPIGRHAAESTNGLIRFWNPRFRDDTPSHRVEEAMRALLRHLITARHEAGLADLILENRPGDDLPHNDAWLRALDQEGYKQTCAYRAYVLEFDSAPVPKSGTVDISMHEIASADEKRLCGLYRQAKSRTLEQRDVQLDRPERAIAAMKAIGDGRHPSTWLIATVDGCQPDMRWPILPNKTGSRV